MSFEVNYPAKPDISIQGSCCRCTCFCEMAPIGTGVVPTGDDGSLETIKRIVLCMDCKALMDELPKKFWYEGWPAQRKRGRG